MWFVTVVKYQVTGLTCSFVYGIGLQPTGIIHNNLAGCAHRLLFFHLRPANQPTITAVDLWHKNVGCPRFTETRAIRYQPSVSVHNVPLHSAIQLTKPATEHVKIIFIVVPSMLCAFVGYVSTDVKITSFSLPIYSPLKFTYVIEYDRRPHSDTQTEWNIHKVTNCN